MREGSTSTRPERHGFFARLPALGIGLFVLAGVAGSLVRGEPTGVLWFVGAGGAAYLGFQLGLALQRWRPALLQAVLVATAVVLSALVLVPTIGGSLGAVGPMWRATGVFANPNAAGSALAVSLAAVLSLSWRWGVLALVPTAAALFMTGSRTALLAAGAALLVTAMRAWVRRARRRPLLLAGLPALSGAVVCVLGVLIWLHGATEPPRNLLISSENLLDESWKWSHSAWAQVTPLTPQAGVPGAGGADVRAQANAAGPYPRLLVSNNVTLGQEGTTYVVSAYFRADEATTIVLGSNYNTTECRLTPEWSRCQTPPAEGNGANYVQFKLSASQPGAAVAFQLRAPQVEAGDAASDPQASWRTPVRTLVNEVVMPRLAPAAWPTDRNVATRLAAFRVAWSDFLGSPLLGIGKGRFAVGAGEAPADAQPAEAPAGAPPAGAATPRVAAHAHNLFLQVAAEEGAIGLLGLLALLLFTAISAARANPLRVLPLLAAALVLNLFDVAFFRAGNYYVYWVALGALSVLPLRSPGAPGAAPREEHPAV